MWSVFITLALIPSMTHLFYNSVLWFYGEVVAKNNKRDRENFRIGVGGERGGLEPRPSQRAMAISWVIPFPPWARSEFPGRGHSPSFRTQYSPHAQSFCLLSIGSWFLVMFLLSSGSFKSSKSNNHVSSWMESQKIRSLLVKDGGVYQVWHQNDLPTWRGNEFKWNILTFYSAAHVPQSRRLFRKLDTSLWTRIKDKHCWESANHWDALESCSLHFISPSTHSHTQIWMGLAGLKLKNKI